MVRNPLRARWARDRRRRHRVMLEQQRNLLAQHRTAELEVWRRDNMSLIELTRQDTFREWFAVEGLGEWRSDFESDPDRFRLEMDKVMVWLYDHPCAALPWL